ncbi:MAG: hypothetical protein AB7O74_14255 [Candidatus Nanopelagicales bacterium]
MTKGDKRRASAWAFSDRLTRLAAKVVGPAQIGDVDHTTVVSSTLPSTPCSACGKPLSDHVLERTTDAKMRLYCPVSEKPTTDEAPPE